MPKTPARIQGLLHVAAVHRGRRSDWASSVWIGKTQTRSAAHQRSHYTFTPPRLEGVGRRIGGTGIRGGDERLRHPYFTEPT